MPNASTQSSIQYADACAIVRTCRRPAFLSRAIGSILAQVRLPRQLVVVDEGGQGEARALLAEIAFPPEMSVVLLENAIPRGEAAALNQGLAVANTRWIAILDDDDTWDPRFLDKTVGWLEANGAKCCGVVTLTTVVEERETASGIKEIRRRRFNPPDFCSVTIHGVAGGSQFTVNAFVYARDVALALGGHREDLPVQDDWEFNMRFLQRHSLGLIPVELACYHMRPRAASAATANTNPRRHEVVRQQIIEGWLRQELETGRFGLGQLCMQAGFHREFAAFFRWKRSLLLLLRRLGMRRG